MRLTYPIIVTISTLAWGGIALFYTYLAQYLNEGGDCTGVILNRYGTNPCKLVLGVKFPHFLQLTPTTYMNASIVIGFFGAMIVGLICLILKQRNT